MKKYFGIIDRNRFNQLEKKQQIQYLVSRKLFYLSNSIPLDVIDSKLVLKGITMSQKYKPCDDVLQEFYDFVLAQYEYEITNRFINFFNDYNDEIYGLDKTAQKNIGLRYFNDLYSQGDIKGARFVKKEISNKGVLQIKNMNRFQYLKYRQNGIKENIATLDNVFEFLTGNKEFFNIELLENNTYFNKTINFEYILKVLVSLNDRHNFEDDLFFSDMGILKAIFEKYTHIFFAFDVFVFVHKEVKDLKPNQIDSLYDALVQLDLIGGKKSFFIKYLNQEYDMEVQKIRKFDSQTNREHDFRVKNYKRELQKFSTEK